MGSISLGTSDIQFSASLFIIIHRVIDHPVCAMFKIIISSDREKGCYLNTKYCISERSPKKLPRAP